MTKPPKPADEMPGVQEHATHWIDADEQAEALAALEEFRQTGVSYSLEEARAELERLIAERRAPKA